MKTELFTFTINPDKREQIAKYFFKNLDQSNQNEIDICIEEIEKKCCEFLNKIFMELKILDKDLTFKIFMKELKIFEDKIL